MSKDTELTADATTEGKANLKLWKSVEKTAPEMTKLVSYGKRKYTTIDPQWQLRVATALWGPYGHRWGMRNLKYEIKEFKGKDIIMLATRDGEGKLVQSVDVLADFNRQSLILEAEFFYPVGDNEASFTIINDDKYQVDDDVFKKLITNTRSKALSWLGFSADVFLGKFDDTRYVEDLRKRFTKQNAFVAAAVNRILEAKDLDELAACEDRLDEVAADQAKDVDASAIEELRELITERRQIIRKQDK